MSQPPVLSMLTETARTAMQRREFVLCLRDHGYSLSQIARRLNLTRSRISDMHRAAVRDRERRLKLLPLQLQMIERQLIEAVPLAESLRMTSKVISKVECPLIDTGSDPKIEP